MLPVTGLMTAMASAASFIGLCAYALAFERGAGLMRRPRIRAALDRATGAVLIALGVRVALERR